MEARRDIQFEEYDLRKLVGVLIRGRWILLLVPVMLFIPTYLVLRWSPSLY